jgi:hypothetical protein
MLFTGRHAQYLSRAPGAPGETSEDAPWWPPHKIAGRHLGPYLAAHPELIEPERGELLSETAEASGCRTAALRPS